MGGAGGAAAGPDVTQTLGAMGGEGQDEAYEAFVTSERPPVGGRLQVCSVGLGVLLDGWAPEFCWRAVLAACRVNPAGSPPRALLATSVLYVSSACTLPLIPASNAAHPVDAARQLLGPYHCPGQPRACL